VNANNVSYAHNFSLCLSTVKSSLLLVDAAACCSACAAVPIASLCTPPLLQVSACHEEYLTPYVGSYRSNLLVFDLFHLFANSNDVIFSQDLL
jgi:hypothetical protein